MKTINLQRTESLLKELLNEAIATLNDNRINGIIVTDVDCKKGKYDAIVFFESSDYSKEEQKQIISRLKRANGYLKSYILGATSWYKCPNFTFRADNSLKNINNIDKLFKQIKASNGTRD